MMFDEEERTAAKHKMIRLASIYWGPTACWGQTNYFIQLCCVLLL